MVEIGLGGKIRTPFRRQPRLVQIGYALIVLGLVLFCIALPLHVALRTWLFNPNAGAFGVTAHLAALAFLTAFLSLGIWITSGLIRPGYEPRRPGLVMAGYEPRRPGLVMAGIAAAVLVVQIAAESLGHSKMLLLIEVIGIPAGLVVGSIVASVGEELQDMRAGRSVGGGLGALAGLLFGLYVFDFDSPWWVLICAVAAGLLAECLGRTVPGLIAWSRRAGSTCRPNSAGRTRA